MEITTRLFLTLVIIFLNTGCAEMAVLTGAALTGAGIADGDAHAAVIGGALYETGMQVVLEEDVDLGKSLDRGLQTGVAVDTGNAGLLASALTRGESDGITDFVNSSGFGPSSNGNPASASAGASGDCEPLPAACTQAMNRSVQFLERIQASGINGITDGASKVACGAKVGIEMANFCASTFAAEGRHQCADLSRQQAEAYRETMRSAEATASAASIRNVRNKCSFEN